MYISLSFTVVTASVVCGLVTPAYAPVENTLEVRAQKSGWHHAHWPKPPHWGPPVSHWPPKPHWPDFKPFVTSRLLSNISRAALQAKISTKELFKKAAILQSIADKSPLKNRSIGSLGHNNTVKYITEYLSSKEMSKYYTFYKQGFPIDLPDFTSVKVNGVAIEAYGMLDAPGGEVSGTLYLVPNLACNASDFASFPAGAIALVVRGTCSRGDKVVLAGQAGAIVVVYQNNAPGVNFTNLADISLPHDVVGDLIPTAMIPYDAGVILQQRLAAGEVLTVDFKTTYAAKMSYNIIAETKGGDHDNVLLVCSHSDSVPAGPGINDNGSGSISILEVATQLTKFSVRNAVRFSWWTAEEIGLVGATYYVSQLTAKEKSKIKLVLDYDMMASPNFIYGIYDGDGSAFNSTGPVGSSEAEHEFAAYFDSKGLGHTELEFDGRSDYGPFLEAGIAAGGIAAGAEVLKTSEEAAIFGGEVDVPYDVCYHSACDRITNLNATAWGVMTGAIAHTTAVYAASWETIPSPKKRSISEVLKGRSLMEAEKREKAAATKRALDWVSGPNARQWVKKHQRA